jgi:hypothetical protein
MAFVKGNTLPILKEAAQRPLKGHFLCLGQADVMVTIEELKSMARIASLQLDLNTAVSFSKRPDLAARKCISRETLFKSIGAESVAALDASAFEGAEYIFDMNESVLSDELKERFDVLINHGTMEHVFHVPNFLANTFKMLKVNGRIIHIAPGSNFLDHGFYSFSPTFFVDYYSANNWRIESILISYADSHQDRNSLNFYADYEPGMLDKLSHGGLQEGMFSTFCVATKLNTSTEHRIPQQGFYNRLGGWEILSDSSSAASEKLLPPFRHESGYCWSKPLRKEIAVLGDTQENSRSSPVVLQEQGKNLGPAHTNHEYIRSVGKGCFSHWNDTLYFSTSDNSNPNTNKCDYSLSFPKVAARPGASCL